MTELMYSPKIKPEHLARKAIVYLRQSSEKQVRQNLESQRLQYEVAERIRALGWRQVEIIVVISDTARPWLRRGRKGTSASSVG
jgi:DNA invertase Pin-like site-specific DNA recombinase